MESDEDLIKDEYHYVRKWWDRVTAEDLKMYVDKNRVYGNADLRIIGEGLRAIIPQMPEDCVYQAGVAFYALGKVARILSAYEKGIIPSEDSWKDLAIYAMMGRMAGKEL